MGIAVVTGASSGMGRDFAVQLAAQESFEEMWLIARRTDRLEELADQLPCRCRVLSLDLTQDEALQRYEQLVDSEKPDISVLVNAAGFGRFAHSTEVPLDVEMSMIDLNVKALVALVTLSVPYMQKGARIINMGSASSFQPVPYINVYGATKSFVLSYSRALGVELRPRGIRVICVCPGWVKTEFFEHAVCDNGAVIYYDKFWTSQQVVTKALRDLGRGRALSILGFSLRMRTLLIKLLPHQLVMSTWMKQQGH